MPHKGNIPWNKGKKTSPEVRAKLSAAHMGLHRSEETKKKISIGNMGKPKSEAHRKHMREARRGMKFSERAKESMRQRMLKNPMRYWLGKKRPGMSAEKHPNWKGGITPKNMLVRNSIEYKAWRKAVYERDGYMCQVCKEVGKYLNAHHIKSFADYPDLRLVVDNGVTLCEDCHKLTPNYFWKGSKK